MPERIAPTWRVLIVEDDPNAREFFAASVRACAQLQLLGALSSVEQARQWLADAAKSAQLDVLLTDLGLPDGSGLEVIRLALAVQPRCEALVISMFGDEDNILASIEAGALGYVHKDVTATDVAQSILELKAGASPISPMIARRVLAKYLRMVASNASQDAVLEKNKENTANVAVETSLLAINNEVNEIAATPTPILSVREQEVLELIARGFAYGEIAKLQSVSVYTVQTHIKHLYTKLAVHSKSEAVFEAQRLGLINLGRG